VEGLLVRTLAVERETEAEVNQGAVRIVAELTEQVEGPAELGERRFVVPDVSERVAELVVRVSLPRYVTGALCRRDGGLLRPDPVPPVAAARKVAPQGAGHLPGVPLEAAARGVFDAAEQDLVLAVQPG